MHSIPSQVGYHAVVGTINDALYQGSSSGTLTILAPRQTLIMLR